MAFMSTFFGISSGGTGLPSLWSFLLASLFASACLPLMHHLSGVRGTSSGLPCSGSVLGLAGSVGVCSHHPTKRQPNLFASLVQAPTSLAQALAPKMTNCLMQMKRIGLAQAQLTTKCPALRLWEFCGLLPPIALHVWEGPDPPPVLWVPAGGRFIYLPLILPSTHS